MIRRISGVSLRSGRCLRTTWMALLSLMIMLTGCVHEFPEPEEPEPPTPPEPEVPHVNLLLDLGELDFYKFVDYTSGSSEEVRTRSRASALTHHMRYVVRAYPVVDIRGHTRNISRAPVDCGDAVVDIAGDRIEDIPLELTAGDYELLAWVEYVPYAFAQDYYYSTSNLTEIKLLGDPETSEYIHEGNNPWRVAWRGQSLISVNEDGEIFPEGSEEPVTELDVRMLRPMARYHFVTTDLDEFIKNQSQMHAPTNPEDAPAPQINLDDYLIRMVYTGYMPYAYNAHTDKPIDSLTGVSYTGKINRIDDKQAELGFDYVFVNGSETSVQVALQLYRKSDGELLSSTGSINVPIVRGKYTVVTGRFLTAQAGAGMGINADFYDDFNIEL